MAPFECNKIVWNCQFSWSKILFNIHAYWNSNSLKSYFFMLNSKAQCCKRLNLQVEKEEERKLWQKMKQLCVSKDLHWYLKFYIHWFQLPFQSKNWCKTGLQFLILQGVAEQCSNIRVLKTWNLNGARDLSILVLRDDNPISPRSDVKISEMSKLGSQAWPHGM